MKHCLLSLCFCFLFLFVRAGGLLKIAVVSDVHYLSQSLMDNGVEIQKYEARSAKNIRTVPALLSQTLTDLEAFAPDVLLLPGDLSKDGELQSHLDLKQQIDRLAAKGTRVFVIPGNHDILVPHPVRYQGETTQAVPHITPSDFARIYHDFGFDASFSRDTASLSYAVALNDKTWLIAIDSNRYKEYTSGTISSGRVLPETEQWVVNLLAEARRKQVTVFGMMHHGLVEHFMFQSLFYADYLVRDWQRLATVFADGGMKVVFTGHFHANDITAFTTPAGNTIYDTETGSLSSFPFPYRKMVWNGDSLNVHTINIRSLPGNPDLAVQDSIAKLSFATENAKRQIQAKFSELPDSTAKVLAQLIGRIYILHVRGDEKMDEPMRQAIEKFSALMGGGGALDLADFKLDFPPADNDVVLPLK